MKRQQTFSDIEYSKRKRVSRREIFLQKMDTLMPWAELEAVIRLHYYAGKRGRPPRGIEMMLRMYLLQVWYNLPDETAEEEIYGSHAVKEFLRIDFQKEDAPDAAALPGFCHLLEQHGLQRQLFEKINQILEQEGMLWRGGSIIDAAIIEAPGSTKNSGKSRDPEMKQTNKGNERHFGMKARIGADAGAGMAHKATFTAADEHDIQEAHRLVRAEGTFANAGTGCIGIGKREEIIKDEHLSQVQRRVNERKGKSYHRAKALYKDAVNRDAVNSAFGAFFFQFPSLLRYMREMREREKRDNAQSLFDTKGIPSDNQIRNIVDEIEPSAISVVFNEAQQPGVINEYRILDGGVLVAVDGLWYLSSGNIHCTHCLSKKVKDKEGEEETVVASWCRSAGKTWKQQSIAGCPRDNQEQ